MYSITSLLNTIISFSLKILNILFNPSIDDAQQHWLSKRNQMKIITATHSDPRLKLFFQEVLQNQVKSKNWVILVVKPSQSHLAQEFIKRHKPFKHLIVNIKSNEAKWWATEQALTGRNCSAVVLFVDHSDNHQEKISQLSDITTSTKLIVVTSNLKTDKLPLLKAVA